jgi:hypothetical protein
MSVCVVTPDKKQLMPTSEYRARKLLKSAHPDVEWHMTYGAAARGGRKSIMP